MKIVKWKCQNCRQPFYTEGKTPVCQCSWNNDMRFLWVDYEPKKNVFDEVARHGGIIKPQKRGDMDVWIFTAHCYADTPEEAEEMVQQLPF